MSAIDPRETARYAGRLFGYFLTVAIVGGGIAAGGAVLLRNTNVLSGGSVDVGAEVIVGSALTAVGALVVLAGFFAIVLNVIADGVRFGVETTTAEAGADGDRSQVPRRTPSQYWRPPAQPTVPSRHTQSREGGRRGMGERTREPTGEGAEGDEPWKREVEEKLAGEDRPGRGRADQRPSAAGAPRDSGGGEMAGREPEAVGDRPAAETGVERDPGGEQYTHPPDTQEGQSDAGESDRSEGETWVSGEDVGSGEPPTSERGENVGTDDEAPVPEGGEDPDRGDSEDTDADSPAWVTESDESDTDEDT